MATSTAPAAARSSFASPGPASRAAGPTRQGEAGRPAFDSILLERATDARRIGNTLAPRLVNWESGIEAFAERPVLGWGTGNYHVASARYIEKTAKRTKIRDHAHNIVVEEAATHSVGEGGVEQSGGAERDYDVEKATLTAVNPYVRVKLTDRVSAWGLAGYGQGDLELVMKQEASDETPAGSGTWRTDLAMTLGALGARGDIVTPEESGGYGLALKGDAFWVRMESDAVTAPGVGNLAATRADASRLRLTLEGSRAIALGAGGGADDAQGATLTPSLEIGVRQDGGDAETGTGLELGGGIAYADPASRLSMNLRARGLVAHAESGYEEWGVSGALQLSPGASGRGLSLSLTPAFGSDTGGADRLWSARDAAALTANGNADPAARLETEVGYGLAAFDGAFTGTPYAGFGYSDTERKYRLGWRLTRPAGAGAFQFSLEASRRETADGGAAPEHGIGFRFTSRW